MSAIELLVQPQSDDPKFFEVLLLNHEPRLEDTGVWFCSRIPELFLDLVPWMVARELIAHYYEPSRTLVVNLRGSDKTMMRAPLGEVAATPLVNSASPVKEPAHPFWYGVRS